MFWWCSFLRRRVPRWAVPRPPVYPGTHGDAAGACALFPYLSPRRGAGRTGWPGRPFQWVYLQKQSAFKHFLVDKHALACMAVNQDDAEAGPRRQSWPGMIIHGKDAAIDMFDFIRILLGICIIANDIHLNAQQTEFIGDHAQRLNAGVLIVISLCVSGCHANETSHFDHVGACCVLFLSANWPREWWACCCLMPWCSLPMRFSIWQSWI